MPTQPLTILSSWPWLIIFRPHHSLGRLVNIYAEAEMLLVTLQLLEAEPAARGRSGSGRGWEYLRLNGTVSSWSPMWSARS